MSSLVNKMKEARKVEITIGEMKFIGRRPTLEEFGRLYNDNSNSYEIAYKFITGWDNVKESDLFPEGTGELVQFSPEVFREFICDAPSVAESIRDALVDALNKYLVTKEVLQKN